MAKGNKYNSEKFNAPFAMNLRKLMDSRSITQDELSKVVGKTRQTVSQYVNGVSEPGYDTLIKIANYFDVSVDFLLGITADPARHPAATDDLGLSAAAIKRIQYLKMCSSDDRQYMAFLSQFFENQSFNVFFNYLYLDCQASIAETIYSSVEPNVRYSKILEIANSGKYNSVISGFLTQMVRFDQEQTCMEENDNYFPYDCDFAHDLIPEITEKRVKDCFDSYLRSLCQEATRVVEKQLREASTDGND